jgi:hypothetical protein
MKALLAALMLLLCSESHAAWIRRTDSVYAMQHPENASDSLFLKYAYAIPSTGFDSTQPVGIAVYLHGNRTATQDQVIENGFSYLQKYASQYNLLPVVFASPYATAGGVRAWGYEDDGEVLDQLLQKNLDGRIKIDKSKVFFWGASQGTCFLNAFLTLRGDTYGGGGYAMCGCLDYKDEDWQPKEAFRNTFRVFVQANTGDFLWEPSRDAEEYYRYNAGLSQVRSDLGKAGEHCAWNPTLNDSVWRWMANGEDALFPAKPFEPHWSRVRVIAGAARVLTVNPSNQILAVVEESGGENVLMQSADRGRTWGRLGAVAGADSVTDLAVLEQGDIWVAANNGIWLSLDDGATFNRADSYGTEDLWTNGKVLYRVGWVTGLAQWNGSSWIGKNDYVGRILGARSDFSAIDSTQRNLWAFSYQLGKFRVFARNPQTETIVEKNVPIGTFTNLLGDQRGTLAVIIGAISNDSLRLLVSIDSGANWLDRSHASPYAKLYWGMEVAILPNGDILLYGGNSGYLSKDQGQTWVRMPNLRSQFYAHLTADQQGELYTVSGKSVYHYQRFSPSAIGQSRQFARGVRSPVEMHVSGGQARIIAQGGWHFQATDASGRKVIEQWGTGMQFVALPSQNGAYFLRVQSDAGATGALWVK